MFAWVPQPNLCFVCSSLSTPLPSIVAADCVLSFIAPPAFIVPPYFFVLTNVRFPSSVCACALQFNPHTCSIQTLKHHGIKTCLSEHIFPELWLKGVPTFYVRCVFFFYNLPSCWKPLTFAVDATNLLTIKIKIKHLVHGKFSLNIIDLKDWNKIKCFSILDPAIIDLLFWI